jgi:hypothetical protein
MALSTAHAWPSSHVLFVAEEPAAPEIRWPTIYVDTSVASYLTARLNHSVLIARRQRLTRVWWHRYRHHHTLRVSVRVLEEAEVGDPSASLSRLEALRGIVALPFDARPELLADKFVGAGLLPEKARSDAGHIAIAATNDIPLLLTWNCRHLANRVIHRAIVRVCENEGLRCPEICTPEHLMRTYNHARPHS